KSLDNKTEYLKKGMTSILEKIKIPFSINSFGSMISLHFCKKPVVDFKSAMKGNNSHFKNYFHGMLKEGIYLPPSPFESYFLNDSLSYDDIDYTLSSLKKISEKI
ncbi:MAG: aspartate aminotransferase family protein, partial [Flavobacteriaceae bacterium]|nr:aspartate aminotransferase family protein [Flavobacteriaceae bacterium]